MPKNHIFRALFFTALVLLLPNTFLHAQGLTDIFQVRNSSENSQFASMISRLFNAPGIGNYSFALVPNLPPSQNESNIQVNTASSPKSSGVNIITSLLKYSSNNLASLGEWFMEATSKIPGQVSDIFGRSSSTPNKSGQIKENKNSESTAQNPVQNTATNKSPNLSENKTLYVYGNDKSYTDEQISILRNSVRSYITRQNDSMVRNISNTFNNVTQVSSSNPTGDATLSSLTVDGLATSTFAANLEINGSGTTTSSGGFNISGGCFAIGDTCLGDGGEGTVTSVATGNGLTGGPITITGTISINSAGLSTNGLITWNGTDFVATGTPQLTVGYILSTSTTASILPYASTTGISTSGLTIATSVTGPLQAINGVVSASSTLSILYGGTGATSYPANTLIFYNGTKFVATGTPQLAVGNILATSTTAINNFLGNLALSSSTPWAQLAVNPIAGQASNRFVVGSSTATSFIINNTGTVGVATATPSNTYTFGVTGNGYFSTGITLGTALSAANGGTGLTSLGTGIATWLGTPSSANTASALTDEIGTGYAVFNASPNFTGNTGFGTTSSNWPIEVSSGTGPQFDLSDATLTSIHWNFRNAGGNLYIGTSSPTTYSTSTTPAIALNSTSGTTTISFFGATTTGLTVGSGAALPKSDYMIIGNGVKQANISIVNGGLCVDTDGWCTASTTGRISSVTSTVGASDLAEIYNSNDPLEAGDIVAIDAPKNYVKIATDPNNVMGIVSTDPGIILGLKPDNEQGMGQYPIALSGRVPVKISLENGPIRTGDYLTLAKIPGYATRAIKAGVVIGQALDNYSGSDGGKIMVFANVGWFNGTDIADAYGISAQSTDSSKAILGALTSSEPGTISIPVTLSSEIFTDKVAAGIEVISPKVTAQELYVDSIKPALADNITLNLADNGKLIIKGVQEVINFDSHGNAVFAGNITASGINVGKINSPIIEFLASTTAALDARLTSLEKSTSNLSLPSLLSSTDAITITRDLTIKGALKVNKIGSVSDLLSIMTDVVFFGRPYFTTDTAGFALISKGDKKVRVVFEKEYLEQPIVNTSMFLNDIGDVSQTVNVVGTLFDNDIKYVIAEKSTRGFSIIINKPSPEDVQFSWTAIAVKNPKIFNSLQNNPPTETTAEIAATSTPENLLTTTPEVPPAAVSETGNASSTEIVVPAESSVPQESPAVPDGNVPVENAALSN